MIRYVYEKEIRDIKEELPFKIEQTIEALNGITLDEDGEILIELSEKLEEILTLLE